MQDIHMSRLAGWMLNTLGKALLLATLVAFVGGVLVAITGEAVLWAIAVLGSWLTFAIVLYNAAAPMPDE